LSPATISLYVAGVRSYLEHHDIDISPSKLKKRVTMPKNYRDSKVPIDMEDIKTLLLDCTNTRLKVFILVLASSGMRANEALSLRIRDVDFDNKPTKVHIRAEITKTRQGRDVYISDEATKELKKFIDSKHGINSNSNDLIFSMQKGPQTISIYKTLNHHFKKLLEKVGMNERKDGEGNRMEISFHSFRRFVKTAISNQGYGDYSEWILGHRSSMSARYYEAKEQELAEMYKKCMKYLTFLDYPTVQSVGKDFESKLQERDKQYEDLMKEAKKNLVELNMMKSEMNASEDERGYLRDSLKDLEEKVKLGFDRLSQSRNRLEEAGEIILKLSEENAALKYAKKKQLTKNKK
jgi:integrase